MKKDIICSLCGETMQWNEKPVCPNCRARLARAGVAVSGSLPKSVPPVPLLILVTDTALLLSVLNRNK